MGHRTECCSPHIGCISKSCVPGVPWISNRKPPISNLKRILPMYAAIHIPDGPANSSGHASLLDCASAFSPRVEDTATNTILLDIEGLDRLFGSAAELAQQLNLQLSKLGFTANIAMASTPDAAECAARGFTGITIMEPGSEAKRLKVLRI